MIDTFLLKHYGINLRAPTSLGESEADELIEKIDNETASTFDAFIDALRKVDSRLSVEAE